MLRLIKQARTLSQTQHTAVRSQTTGLSCTRSAVASQLRCLQPRLATAPGGVLVSRCSCSHVRPPATDRLIRGWLSRCPTFA